MIYSLASSKCEESEIKPVRYVSSGLLGNQNRPVITTDANADTYMRMCSRTGNPSFFSIADNIEYILEDLK